MSKVPAITLNNGIEIPQMGMGLANGLSVEDTMAQVTAALEAGYRAFDTATRYRNEGGLGIALARSGIAREDLFVTTKVWNNDQGRLATERAFDASLRRLRTDYVDLYLIHFPAPMLGLYVETWLALEDLYRKGRVRAIGVANFDIHHIAELLRAGSVVPMVNQIELHPRFQQQAIREADAAHGIATAAWSPLARGALLKDPQLESMAARRGVTPAQIALCWHLQIGNVVIPKSVTPSRMRENLEAVTLPPLDDEEMASIASLDCNGRIGPDPDVFFDSTSEPNDLQWRWDRMVREADAMTSE